MKKLASVLLPDFYPASPISYLQRSRRKNKWRFTGVQVANNKGDMAPVGRNVACLQQLTDLRCPNVFHIAGFRIHSAAGQMNIENGD